MKELLKDKELDKDSFIMLDTRFSSRSGNFNYILPLFEGDEYEILKDNKKTRESFLITIVPTKDKEKFGGFISSLQFIKKSNTLKDLQEYQESDISNYLRYIYAHNIYNLKDYPKEMLLSMTKKALTSDDFVKYCLIPYYCNSDKEFRIKMYEKNIIFNNQLFYDAFTSGKGEKVTFSKEEIKRILNCKQFTSSAYVMGGSQMQKQNALNHLLKTQELTNDLLEAILEKYEDDQAMLDSTFAFIIKSKKVKTTADVNNLLAEKIVYNEKLHELVKVYKKKFGTNDVKDDGVKLLLECIE